jgi:hypothetical protein
MLKAKSDDVLFAQWHDVLEFPKQITLNQIAKPYPDPDLVFVDSRIF